MPCFSASDCVVSRVDISRASVSPRVSASPSVCSSLSSASGASSAAAALPSASFVAGGVAAAVSGGVVRWWHWVGLKVGVHVHVPVLHSVGHHMHGTWIPALQLAMPIRVQTRLILLRVQRATSYNPEGVVAHNSRRKVRLRSSVGNRSVVQTVDMSPAPAAGTYQRSADKVHDQRQVSRKRQAGSSEGGPGPGPGSGPGGRSGLVGDSLDRAAAFRGIPCILGDATWASPACTAITRLGAGMFYREVGSLGAKG